MLVVDPVRDQSRFDWAVKHAGSDEPLRRAIRTVRDQYFLLAKETQLKFRLKYLAKIRIDHSAPQYAARLKDSLVGRPMQVAIIGDRPNPELEWFDEAVREGEADRQARPYAFRQPVSRDDGFLVLEG